MPAPRLQYLLVTVTLLGSLPFSACLALESARHLRGKSRARSGGPFFAARSLLPGDRPPVKAAAMRSSPVQPGPDAAQVASTKPSFCLGCQVL